MTQEIELPTQYTHSVKIEETAKGCRIHVHAYANGRVEAITQAINTYMLTKKTMEYHKIPLAPMEINGK